MATVTEPNRPDMTPSNAHQPSRRDTHPSKQRTGSTGSLSNQSGTSPLPSESLVLSPFSTGNTAYGYYHIDRPGATGHGDNSAKSANDTARTPSVDPSIVAQQGSVMTNEIFKGHMICDLANHKFVPKRKTIRELWKDDREKPESLPEELDVELGEPDNKGTILVDYDALKAAPGATVNLCSALFAWKAVGHGIQVVTRNKQATAFNLGEGRVYTAGMEGNVVDHIWELANATAADRIAGKGESSDLVEVVEGSNPALLLTTATGLAVWQGALPPGVRVLLLKDPRNDQPPAEETAGEQGKRGRVEVVDGWKECTHWIIEADRQGGV